MEFQQIEGRYPEPHQHYLVKRNDYYFVATPCYGMHNPWWVPMTHEGEIEPVAIVGTDQWIPLKNIISR